jgi:hypothetical protein
VPELRETSKEAIKVVIRGTLMRGGGGVGLLAIGVMIMLVLLVGKRGR